MQLNNGTLAGSANCTVRLNLKGVTLGQQDNNAGVLQSWEAAFSGAATASVTVTQFGPPTGIVSFQPVPGAATDIGVGQDAAGTTWVIGTSGGIYRYDGVGFQQIPGGAVRIAVDNTGNAWVINAFSQVYQYNGSFFVQRPGAALDIGAGADGSIWVIGTDHGIYRYNTVNGSWNQFPGAADRIAVDINGSPWVINGSHLIYHLVNGLFQQFPGQAFDIGAGPQGRVWVIGADNAGGGNHGVYELSESTFIAVSGAGVTISAGGANGDPWVLNAQGGIYRGTQDQAALRIPAAVQPGAAPQAPRPAGAPVPTQPPAALPRPTPVPPRPKS